MTKAKVLKCVFSKKGKLLKVVPDTKAKSRYIDFPKIAWWEWVLFPMLHIKLLMFQDYLNSLEAQGWKITLVKKK
jgi:hypothetical protein